MSVLVLYVLQCILRVCVTCVCLSVLVVLLHLHATRAVKEYSRFDNIIKLSKETPKHSIVKINIRWWKKLSSISAALYLVGSLVGLSRCIECTA